MVSALSSVSRSACSSAACIRLIAFDCRAHGRTHPLGDVNKIRLATFADDLYALLDFLQIKNSIVGGISMGAAVTLNFTLRHLEMVRGLVLLRPEWTDKPHPWNVHIFTLISRLIDEHGPSVGSNFSAKPRNTRKPPKNGRTSRDRCSANSKALPWRRRFVNSPASSRTGLAIIYGSSVRFVPHTRARERSGPHSSAGNSSPAPFRMANFDRSLPDRSVSNSTNERCRMFLNNSSGSISLSAHGEMFNIPLVG